MVSLQGITKRYGPILANDAVDFDLEPGEIHGLLGQNGSGKTTLMSILCGLTRPEAGTIRLQGRAVAWRGPRDALARGIAMIPQQFRLVPTLSVVENVALGFGGGMRRHGAVLKALAWRLRDLADRYGLQIDPEARIEALSMGERQRVEILRALCHESRVLIMDEPTSVLTPQEVERLFAMLGGLVREEGRAVVLVTHKIREVLASARRVTVLRNGRRVATVPAEGLTPEALVELMMGERQAAGPPRAPAAELDREGRPPILTIEGLSVPPAGGDGAGRRAVRDVNLVVRAGEIVGIAGVEGNGQLELELALAGLLKPAAGTVHIAPRDAGKPARHPLVAYIPSDRNRWGLIADFTVAENLLLRAAAAAPAMLPPPARRRVFLALAQELVSRFKIDPPDAGLRVRRLSGGNAQKVVLARELSHLPDLIVAAQPTMGLDVAAAAFVRDRLREAAAAAAGVLVISSDLDELLELCRRIAVMFHGEVMGVWEAGQASPAELGAAMAGLRRRGPSPPAGSRGGDH
jgi:simple sugar transport system ATP-binding protein